MKKKTLYELYHEVKDCHYRHYHVAQRVLGISEVDMSDVNVHDYYKHEILYAIGMFSNTYREFQIDESSINSLGIIGFVFLKICLESSPNVREDFFNTLENMVVSDKPVRVFDELVSFLKNISSRPSEDPDCKSAWGNLLRIASHLGVDDFVLEIQDATRRVDEEEEEDE